MAETQNGFGTVDPDGGELGIVYYSTPLGAARYMIEAIADIFSKLPDEPKGHYYRYAIRLNPSEFSNQREVAQKYLDSLEKNLPEGVSFYKVDTNSIHEVRGASSGVVMGWVVYVITKARKSSLVLDN